MKNLITVLTFMIYSSVSIAANNMSSYRYNEIQNFLNSSSEFQSFIYRYGMDNVVNAYEDSNVEYCSQYKRKRIAIRCVKDQMYNFLEMNTVQ